MAPKKSKQDEWNECKKCKRIVHKKDIPVHADNCYATHGFILNQVFHAHVSVTSVPNQQTTDAWSKLPLQERDTAILINIGVMKLCNLAIGYPCLVNESHILTAWPSENIPPNSVLLPSHLADVISGSQAGTENIVTVRRFIPSSGSEAQHVSIEMEHENNEFFTEEFLLLLKHKMEGRYIREGMRQAIFYFGHMCYFRIISATHLQHPRYEVDTSVASTQSPGVLSDSSELHQSLASLNISGVSDSGDTSLNDSLPATPLKQTTREEPPEVSPSGASRTPERQEALRPEQFCTPVSDRNQQQVDIRTPKFLKVVSQTQFVICRKWNKEAETNSSKQKVTFDALGGLDSQITKITEYCRLLLQKSADTVVPRLPHGILLFGPSGTGKSLLAEATANELGIHTTYISPVNIFSKLLGETEKKLRSVFEDAYQRSPSLIIVDNIDALCLGKDLAQSDLEKRTVNTFLSLMDKAANVSSGMVCIVIGITSKPDLLDPRLCRATRFGMEVETGVPTADDRFQILRKVLQDIPHCVFDADLKVIADAAHGFVGSDLAGVVSKAKQLSWQRSQDRNARLSTDDLKQAAMTVKPSALREVQFEVPKVQWSDIGGQEEVKLKLRQAVEWPLTHPEAFHRMGIKPPCGCLMYGPPGCSKTMIAKALATESGINFLAVKGPELFGKYVGESERAVREIFRKARAAAPSIIFFDEIDSLAVERGKSSGGSNVADRVLTQLLTEMDGVVELKGVTIVAATNRPDMIDKALLRPGRFDRILYVPLPDDATRKEILQIVTRKTPVAPDVSLENLVNRTKGFSGAELTALCHEAGLCAITESREARLVHKRHFETAFKSVQPQTTQDMIKFYEDYCRRSTSGLQVT